MSKNPKNRDKLTKIANTDKEILHIFWTTWGNSMKFSGKICFKIILKVTKNQGFTLSLGLKNIKSKIKTALSTFLDFDYFSSYLLTNEIAWKRGDAILSEPEMSWRSLGQFWKTKNSKVWWPYHWQLKSNGRWISR